MNYYDDDSLTGEELDGIIGLDELEVDLIDIDEPLTEELMVLDELVDSRRHDIEKEG